MTSVSPTQASDVNKVDEFVINQTTILSDTIDITTVKNSINDLVQVDTTDSSSSSTISILLLGLDYVFYIWTFLLVSIVTYLSIYKYYQFYQTQKRRNSNKASQNINNLQYLLNILKNFIIFIYGKTKNLIMIKMNTSPIIMSNNNIINNNKNTNANTRSIFNFSAFNTNLSSQDSYTCLNNCLKWFYFNSETTRRINTSFLNMLNSGTITKSSSLAASKYDDINFKCVDTLPPKFTNIQTIVNDSDNLTLKANIEFVNIDLKIELKKSLRIIDVKLLSLNGQVLIVLGQNKNGIYNLDCYLDQQSDLAINIKKDQNIENSLLVFLENLIKNSAKQFALNLELNFLTKKLSGNSRFNLQLNQATPQNNPNNQVHPPSNLGLSSPSSQTSSTTNKISPTDMNKPNIEFNNYNQNITQLRNSINEKRLLVKLLKATNLTNCEEPYCVIELDYPMQKHLTDVHKDLSVINEQFLFDITSNSEELNFSIYDRAKDYGNDLIGEAVVPVTDLCTSLNGKRVIQLHRYGQNKTGSIHAEFLFIEPTNSKIEPRPNRGSTASRTSRSPYEQYGDNRPRSPSDPQNLLAFKDEIHHDQKLGIINQDNMSNNSFSGPGSYQSSTIRSNFTPSPYTHSPSSLNQANNIQILNDSGNRQSFIQQTPQQQTMLGMAANQGSGMSTTGRVINRNYLQVQGNSTNKSNTLNSSPMSSSLYTNESIKSSTLEDPKRTRSISRSLRSLFNRQSKSSKKRDKSYDVANLSTGYDIHSVDNDNLKKSKTIGGSLKKLFTIKKNSNKKYEGSVHEQRPGSPTTISITVSRPSDQNLTSSTISAGQYVTSNQPQQFSTYQSNQFNNPFQNKQENNINFVNMNKLNNKTNEDSYERKEPLLLKRGYISP